MAKDPLDVKRARSAPVRAQRSSATCHLELIGETRLKAKPILKALGKRFRDDAWVVPKDVRVMSLPEIQDAMPIRIGEIGAGGARDARWIRLEKPYGVAAAVE